MSDLYGLTIKDVLNKFLVFEGNILIFFDTETLGLKPEEEQLLEVAAIAFDGTTFVRKGVFHQKVKLSKETQQKAKSQDPLPSPSKPSMKLRDIMKMTQYGERYGRYEEEKRVLTEFNTWIGKFKNPVLIAHNAAFDMNFVATRGAKHGITMKPYKVLDTLKIAQLFFIPALQSLKELGNAEAKVMLDKLAGKYGPSATLGNLSTALDVDIKNWHSALADVESMIGVLRKIVDFLNKNSNLDISKHHNIAVKRDQYYAKK